MAAVNQTVHVSTLLAPKPELPAEIWLSILRLVIDLNIDERSGPLAPFRYFPYLNDDLHQVPQGSQANQCKKKPSLIGD
jgi:hypothetical protein